MLLITIIIPNSGKHEESHFEIQAICPKCSSYTVYGGFRKYCNYYFKKILKGNVDTKKHTSNQGQSKTKIFAIKSFPALAKDLK